MPKWWATSWTTMSLNPAPCSQGNGAPSYYRHWGALTHAARGGMRYVGWHDGGFAMGITVVAGILLVFAFLLLVPLVIAGRTLERLRGPAASRERSVGVRD